MNKFKYLDAKTVAEAASALKDGKSALIAGGTDLLTVLKDYVNPTQPETVVNIKNIPNLDYIKEEGGMLKIGALTTLTDIHNNSVVKSKYASLAEAAHRVGTPQLRNAGTIAGNLCQQCRCWYYRAASNYFYCLRKGGTICQAVPGNNTYNAIIGADGSCFAVTASDTAIPLTALGATIVTNERSIPIGDFYRVLGNNLRLGEIVTEIQVPQPATGTRQAFKRFSHRKAFDFAISSVAVSITVSGGNVADCRIVLSASPKPFRSTDGEAALKGKAVNESSAEAAAEAALGKALKLPHNGYLVPLTKTLVKRAILAAA